MLLQDTAQVVVAEGVVHLVVVDRAVITGLDRRHELAEKHGCVLVAELVGVAIPLVSIRTVDCKRSRCECLDHLAILESRKRLVVGDGLQREHGWVEGFAVVEEAKEDLLDRGEEVDHAVPEPGAVTPYGLTSNVVGFGARLAARIWVVANLTAGCSFEAVLVRVLDGVLVVLEEPEVVDDVHRDLHVVRGRSVSAVLDGRDGLEGVLLLDSCQVVGHAGVTRYEFPVGFNRCRPGGVGCEVCIDRVA